MPNLAEIPAEIRLPSHEGVRNKSVSIVMPVFNEVAVLRKE